MKKDILFKPDQEKINKILDHKKRLGEDFPKYAVFIVAYKAMQRLVEVLERIPAPIYDILTEIYIFDDFSPDQTYEVCREFLDKSRLDKVSLYKNPRNYGYGGNQKLGYEYAIAKDYNYVILLHGDGQYAPEYLPDLMLPTLERDAQVVFGSRMMEPGSAKAGGMPLYKLAGNKILSAFENILLNMELTEYHSGYRLYGTRFLKRIKYKLNTDDFHFDTQIIIQCQAAGEKIYEVPIPTYYGDEICHVNGIKYAFDVCMSVIDFRLHQLGITRTERYIPVIDTHYELKDFPFSSHQFIINMVADGSSVLELGCGKGLLAERLKQKNCRVSGVDLLSQEDVSRSIERYCEMDVEDELSLPFGREFDYVILADVIEHLRYPEKIVRDARKYLKENGRLIVSVPNIALWVYRLSLMAGRFEYTDKGIMDRSHIRFFTLPTARYLLWSSGFNIVKENFATIPFHYVITLPAARKFVDFISKTYYVLARLWPRMFAYQFVIEAEIVRLEWNELKKLPIKIDEPHPHIDNND